MIIDKSNSLFFCFFTILLIIFGCGSDNENPIKAESPSEKIVGSWELITVNSKSPKRDAQEDMGDEWEVVNASEKLVFTANSSLVREQTVEFTQRVEDNSLIPGWLLEFTIRFQTAATVDGSYVISDQTIEFISGGRSNIDISFSIDDSEGFEALKELEQEINKQMIETTRVLEDEFASNIELELDTYTFDFNGNQLTLLQGSERKVYRKQ